MRTSVLALFWLNITFVLFPVISPDRDPTGVNSWFFNEVTLFGQLLSSVLTPLIVVAALGIHARGGRRGRIPAGLLFSSLVICALMTLSTAFSDRPRIETIVMAVFFVLFTIFLSLMKDQPDVAEPVVRSFRAYMTVWMLAPCVWLVFDPSLFDMFVTITPIDISYHGLTNSRVGYGLWMSTFILLLGKPTSRWTWFLMAVAVITLLLSQSRAAIVGLTLALAYGMVRDGSASVALVRRFVLVGSLAVVPLYLWSTFGRDDALTFLSEDRGQILARFSDFIADHWLLGAGGMHVIDMPEIDKFDVPAHNLAVQAVANYGVLTLLAMLTYFVCIFQFFQSTKARVLLIFFFVYSMNQPVQGTGNLFNPITLLYFLVVMAVEMAPARVGDSAPRALALRLPTRQGDPRGT
jgi:hypothetical protein